MDADEYVEESSIQYPLDESSVHSDDDDDNINEIEDEMDGDVDPDDPDYDIDDYKNVKNEKVDDEEEYTCNICKRNYKTPAVSIL